MKKSVLSIALLILALTLALCACAQGITEVRVTFDGQGGTTPENVTLSLADGENVTLPVPTREYYRFVGWSFDVDGSDEYSFKVLKEKNVAEITLYAVWEPVLRTLAFDGNGATAPASMKASLPEADSLVLPTPTRREYHFIGWTFDEAGEDAYSVAKLREKGEGEIMLYAQWEPYKEDERITIRGLTDGKTTVNPSFDWNNLHNDNRFRIELTDASGELVMSTGTSATHIELARYLETSKRYTLTVTGEESGFVYSCDFETCAGSDADYASAGITFSDPFGSHMVIQRERPVVLSGKTNPNVTVTVDFKEDRYYATSDATGAFTVTLPAQSASTLPAVIEARVLVETKATLSDVLFGDVFLASGQSNMWWKLRDSDYDTEIDIANAVRTNMRYYSMRITKSTTPLDKVTNGKWSAISRSDTSYKDYSAIAFMTGSMVAAEAAKAGVPIGIMQSAEGDTNIANWISNEYYDGSVSTKNINYNAMIYPLRHIEIKGVIWYQGCNNSAKGSEYEVLLKSLFANWRDLFCNETLPFYVVQLPVYDDSLAAASGKGAGNPYDFSYVRESQLNACESDDNAYLIATCDGGDPSYIHPAEKRYIAARLTKSILSTLYGADYLPQGPTYASHAIEGNRAIITVKNGAGLSAEGEIVGFMLAGADGKYYDASATISEGKIVVTSAKVESPVYVKYGFSRCPFLNIYNKDGYLMSPFRTDDHNVNIDLLDYRDDVQYALHPQGSEMNYQVVSAEGETGLEITKADDDKGFGSLQLTKLGAIAYKELDLDLTVTAFGTNSGAKVSFRVVEGSYEIWSYTFTDDFEGKRTFTVSAADMVCAGNLVDGTVDFQAVRQVEVTLTHDGAATVTILGVKFVKAVRTAPRAFTLREARNDGREVTVKYTRAGFATSYRVIVSEDPTDFSDPVYDESVEGTQVTFDPACLAENATYYVKVVASNELGETVAKESGMTLSSLDRFVVAEMNFADDDAFDSFAAARLKVKSTLQASRSDRGLKVNVAAKDGWAFCILNFEEGANVGYNTLKFYADFTEYAGDYVCIQFQNAAGDTSYSYNFYYKSAGFVEIPFSSFKKSGEGMGDTSMAKIAFNLVDYTSGGESDNIYIKNVEFLKK